MDELHKVPFLVRHVLDTLVAEMQSTVKSDTQQEIPQTYRSIPALLMRIVMPPNASRAVWMTAAPSATEEELTTALPPASRIYGQSKHRPTCKKVRAPFVISSTTFCAASLLTSLTTTFAPRDAKSKEYLHECFNSVSCVDRNRDYNSRFPESTASAGDDHGVSFE